jgi:hypothetical protein
MLNATSLCERLCGTTRLGTRVPLAVEKCHLPDSALIDLNTPAHYEKFPVKSGISGCYQRFWLENRARKVLESYLESNERH